LPSNYWREGQIRNKTVKNICKNYLFCLKNTPEYPLAGVPKVISKINWQIGIPGIKRILTGP
jgi:hypothetical protein